VESSAGQESLGRVWRGGIERRVSSPATRPSELAEPGSRSGYPEANGGSQIDRSGVNFRWTRPLAHSMGILIFFSRAKAAAVS
jgi:hypothetical protein